MYCTVCASIAHAGHCTIVMLYCTMVMSYCTIVMLYCTIVMLYPSINQWASSTQERYTVVQDKDILLCPQTFYDVTCAVMGYLTFSCYLIYTIITLNLLYSTMVQFHCMGKICGFTATQSLLYAHSWLAVRMMPHAVLWRHCTGHHFPSTVPESCLTSKVAMLL